MGFNQIFRDRTKKFAISVIQSFSSLSYSDDVLVIRKQLIRSSTSAAANYRAVGKARSERERFAKMYNVYCCRRNR
ncbi:four helix bundle protein [Elizabethkingia anophelis]|uniref:four helix bundle protein n=1 Tax=Elizabethkingia anophelis TaxID=1117645 RepID=UPI0021A7F4A6